MFSMEHLLKGSWGFPWGPFCGDFNQNTVPPSWRLNANSKKHQPINQPKRLICFCLRPSAQLYHQSIQTKCDKTEGGSTISRSIFASLELQTGKKEVDLIKLSRISSI